MNKPAASSKKFLRKKKRMTPKTTDTQKGAIIIDIKKRLSQKSLLSIVPLFYHNFAGFGRGG
jgi:hypothetical protein